MLKQDFIQSQFIYSNRLLQLERIRREKLEVNKEQEEHLKAFIEIAKAHATKLKDSGEYETYDTGTLSRLMVQIDNGSCNDQYAEKLFTHASSQLRNTRAFVKKIDSWYDDQKKELERLQKEQKIEIERNKENVFKKTNAFVCSEIFKEFMETLKNDSTRFNKGGSGRNISCEEISIGTKRVHLPVTEEIEDLIIKVSGEFYDNISKTVGVPVTVNIKNGSSFLIEYKNENEHEVLNGIQNFILNLLRGNKEYDQIIYIDPVRYNNSSLGILQPLSVGNNSIIDNVPVSIEEVRKKIESLITQINSDGRRLVNKEISDMPRRLLFFHNFPHAYDASVISQIQQLFVNARYYNITIIATLNMSSKKMIYPDVIALIRTVAQSIKCNEFQFQIEESGILYPFSWYKMPKNLPDSIKEKYIVNKSVLDTGNNYNDRVGIKSRILYKKGSRRLENIPYGVDANGNILTLDFENSNFATFICGASRSGKSTLLHTLITGFIKNKHPDDIEIWLIDFKMTEFSRYIEHLPPHVRYIILDESPELIYDIIDRLTEILIKRQNIFKGKWQKMDDVPKNKYMPEILVIIDEFSVMSQIIADSASTSKENYSLKLQTLLAKGAALGLRFIFSSQGFTSGTRGLSDFSKKQIQQRIAMKTEYNEIRETLDLKSASDDDRAMMEQLPIHHALVRIPVNEWGNHLKQTKVLYIEDYKEQESLIDQLNLKMKKAPRYDADDAYAYIDKKSMVIDGTSYSAFLEQKHAMSAYIENHKNYLDNDETILFLGEPRRMLPLYPIILNKGFCENILMLASITEKMTAASVVMSIAQSLKFVDKDVDIWATKKNEVYKQVIIGSQQKVNHVFNELGDICSEIRRIRLLIENKTECEKYIFILGTETLMMDMSYQDQDEEVSRRHLSNGSQFSKIEKRVAGEMDLNTLLASISGKEKQNDNFEEKNNLQQKVEKIDSIAEYDARTDLKFIMTQGPRLGVHFIILFNTVGELNQSRLDQNLFRHKILFKMAKADAAGIIGVADANVVSELENHSFRYSNGIDALSFRPYLHPGLSWDGWSMSGEMITNEDEEEYLM